MRRTTIALLAALEAAVCTLVGYGIALVPLMVLWATRFELAAPLDVFFRAAADAWLVGHGVDLVVRLDELTAASLGVDGAAAPFTITIALLGFSLLTFAFGLRIGRRASDSGTPIVGAASAIVVVGLLGAGLALLGTTDVATPVVWQGAVMPALVMAAGVLIGIAIAFTRGGWSTDATTGAVRRRVDAFPLAARAGVRSATRIGVGSAMGVIAVAAVLVTVRIVVEHPTIIGLSQALAAGVDGGIAIVLAELALLPNLIIWAAAWILGPGFALGAGTTVSPSVTLIGPVPGLPLLGALPAEGAPLGVLWLALPVLLGFGGAALVARSAPDRDGEPWWVTLAVGLASGGVAGAVLGVLAACSAGAVGPGRLAEVGPDALLVAASAAASVGVGAIAGAFAARSRSRHGAAEAGGSPLRSDPDDAERRTERASGAMSADTVPLEGISRGGGPSR
ncbi:hypothetical protein BCL57_002829 [Agromyces flavus]|uniref:Integral membrane protein n=1 Tax=Agromyces flavus TaxID=589382 RepID=A0A1H1LYE9_9MICO|nr:DUF6350 family protein [Agromyces flavus]MCP2368653.1 hypothetical protein [Agromyces flavus]GGI48107.1 hypothetical protein GCM10010932_27950 [Agromyces flavus]SDR78799.1 hypothetical protein SAMN04489721_0282 [Agromyces flavus]